jgi:prevent-host-death family protein
MRIVVQLQRYLLRFCREKIWLANVYLANQSMKTVTIHEAKTNLSRLIARACRGEEVIIARGKDPVVRLVPIGVRRGKRKLGILKGKLKVGPEFFEPLPPEELARWE